ncbi:phosphoribosyltransferase [Treponema sp. OMZ 787]|uniref:phosphoribosyltransferase n=1 Tax=Treponema sp. OMZ 787 TaxID=2563669 RepID=UPI0020A56999|nr:phosphoribosyltransferase [Treponema sp. OMZ 787]UTC61495.1 phosphoribosyltransferase [Treponema sp. OMZ 787]
MKEFLNYNTVRDNGLILARKMYDEGYIPDVIYASMRGGAYLANVISEFFKIAYKNEKKILYSTVVAHSYSGVHNNSEVVLDGWTLHPSKLPADSLILLVDDIFDSGATINYLVSDLIKQGLKRDNIKIAVHDYKYFHDKKEQYEYHPDYWCRKHDIYTEKDNLWIHYMSHELVGLSGSELEENYYSKNPALRNVFKGIID